MSHAIKSWVALEAETRGPLLWIETQFDLERDRWILWLPVLFGLGIALYFSLDTEPSNWLGAGGVAASAFLAGLFRRNPAIPMLFLAFGMVSAGFSVAKLRSDIVAAPVLTTPLGPGMLSGRIRNIEAFPGRPRLTLDRLVWEGRGAREPLPERVVLRAHGAIRYSIGDRISGKVRLLPLPGPVAPGAYDFQRKSWFERVGATGYALGAFQLREPKGDSSLLSDLAVVIAKGRFTLSERIAATVHGPEGAVIGALITGDRSRIPETTTSHMRDSGLAHLLAISGLHLGLVAGIIFGVLRFMLALVPGLALRTDVKKWAAGAAILASFGYLILSGATLPTQRAFIMGSFVLCAILLDREAISLRLVALAAFIVLALSPESLLSASFQMSFAAVVALVAFYEVAAPWFRILGPPSARLRRRLMLYFFTLIATTVIAGVSTGLIAYFHFGRITHYGVLSNLVAIPLTAMWVMPAGVLSCLLMPFGLESFGLHLMALGVGLVLNVAQEVSTWPGAVTATPQMPLEGFIVAVIGGLWLCLMRRRWRLCGVGVVGLGLLVVPLTEHPDILISQSGRLVAVRMPDGKLSFLELAGERFVAGKWLQSNGQTNLAYWRDLPKSAAKPLCDRSGCIIQSGRHRVAYIKHQSALPEDCRTATLILTNLWRRRICFGSAPAITKRELERNGAYAIYLSGASPRLVSANSVRGKRPWTLPH